MKEKAVLIGILQPSDSLMALKESLEELKELSETAGAFILDSIIQRRKEIDPKYFIGKGKVKQIKSRYRGITLLIFNHELSPTQIRNLEKALDLKVITRTELILDIFAMHARSNLSRLQVELAQLLYELPRITGKGISLSRLGGGIGTRGPGEQQLELDRRLIKKKILIIKKKLELFDRGRKEQRKSRMGAEFKIAIIGYTNSGKSTLLRRLTKAAVLVENKLFATLDTTTRKLWLGINNGRPARAVITDTVGFIRDIPHGLIESFRSTLQDTIGADLLIHLIDLSSNGFNEKKEIVNNTLEEIGASAIPVVVCYNKIDVLPPEKLLEYRLKYPDSIYISAEKNLFIDILIEKIKRYYDIWKAARHREGQMAQLYNPQLYNP
jgi:GTP-binding protein HflX